MPEPAAGAGLDDRPERLLIAARLSDGEGERYVFVRWEDWPYPAMLSLAPPGSGGRLPAGVAAGLSMRRGL